jgi:hypothetical protein
MRQPRPVVAIAVERVVVKPSVALVATVAAALAAGAFAAITLLRI